MKRYKCQVKQLGVVDYLDAQNLQNELKSYRADNTVDDTLLLLENPPTFTLGLQGNENHLLVSCDKLNREGIKLYYTDRGGSITFHSPGQLVGYPIMDLMALHLSATEYIRKLEKTIIQTLSLLGIKSNMDPGNPGVWIGEEKIASIGVNVDTRGITSHGFALNVNNDLSFFNYIIPCGIRDKGVTSLSEIMGQPIPLKLVAEAVCDSFGRNFNMVLESRSGDTMQKNMKGRN